jgi:hypothetical protein
MRGHRLPHRIGNTPMLRDTKAFEVLACNVANERTAGDQHVLHARILDHANLARPGIKAGTDGIEDLHDADGRSGGIRATGDRSHPARHAG